MWVYLLRGIGFGFAAASQPGPFQTHLISQALTRGWKRTLPAALAPLLSDGPIILLCVLLLSQVPDWLQRALNFAGGIFILYLACGAFQSWKKFDPQAAEFSGKGTQQSVLKAAAVNMLSHGPYLFWTLVTGPILLQGWRETPLHGIGFLAGFYAAFISALAAIIFIFGTAAKLGPKFNRALLGISFIVLFGFGLVQLWKGIEG